MNHIADGQVVNNPRDGRIAELERQLAELKGTLAVHGKAGVVRIDRTALARRPAGASEFPEELPLHYRKNEFIRAADQAMYDAKGSGKNRISTGVKRQFHRRAGS